MTDHRALVVVTVLVATLALPACSGAGAGSSVPAPTGTPTASRSTEVGAPVPSARRADSVLSPQAPRLAVLPSGRRVPIRGAGTTASGLLAVPDDVDTAGWWRGGSRLGDPFGSVLVAAHVDSRTQGLGPFAELLTLDPGARVTLRGSRLTQVFEIDSRRLVPQGRLTGEKWIFAASGDLRLTLVTCAPPYDADRGGYQNLAVVVASPLGPPEES